MAKPVTDPELDVLLTNLDLPDKHEDYFQAIPLHQYKNNFSMNMKLIVRNGRIRRLAVVLPLLLDDEPDKVIPIPFIVDTGAPEFLYLCSTAVDRLKEQNGIEESKDPAYSYELCGDLLGPRNTSVRSPKASILPHHHEKPIPGDPRANLIGLAGIIHFGYIKVNVSAHNQTEE